MVSATTPTEFLVDTIVHLLIGVQRQIEKDLKNSPQRYLEKKLTPSTSKLALSVDSDAENSFARKLADAERKVGKIKFYGEESLSSDALDLSGRKGLVALADIVDGTDLLERGMGNWCSAITIYAPTNPRGSRIRASFIALPPNGSKVYVARDDQSEVHVRLDDGYKRVAGPSSVKRLADASICFYGQKTENLLESVGRLSRLRRKSLKNLRIYNLAGMPMMAKLVDHWISNASGIDAVFDVKGQQPHDVVPGLYMAKKAGCTVRDLEGNDLSFEALEDALLKPSSSRIAYVAASTPELCDELLDALQPYKAEGDTGELPFSSTV